MNRKIFTLLAGAFLMLTMVFTASAQFQNPQALKLGPKVDKLNLGPNEYYHLRVEGVSLAAGRYYDVEDNFPDSSYVLYMGNELANQEYPIFIANLGKAGKYQSYWSQTASGLTGGPWFTEYGTAANPNSLKSRESASSLWCTVVTSYDQGVNITFDFTNKYTKGQLLEVDINGYEAWDRTLNGDQSNYVPDGAIFTPGGISGWQFSDTYATGVEAAKPLFSYITPDTVAVLCVDIDEFISPMPTAIGAKVYVKIAAANDVIDGKIAGVLYFSLYEGAPFVLDAQDFNTMFAEYTTWARRKLTFDPNVSPSSIVNYFSRDSGLYAEHISVTTPVTFTIPDGFAQRYSLTSPILPIYNVIDTLNAEDYDTNRKPVDNDNFRVFPLGSGAAYKTATGYDMPANFDDMGYMYLRRDDKTNSDYLYTRHNYYAGNSGGSQFLDFGWRQLHNSTSNADTLLTDLHLYGQSIWRLVYYPTGDSIYINPFQATYLPSWDAAMLVTSPNSAPGFENKPLTWTSILTQSSDFYTFRALLENLEDAQSIGTGATGSAGDRMEDRLKYGKHTYAGPDFYSYYHRNYVTIQDLTGTTKIVTLGNGSALPADHTIDTRIYFDIYDPCKAKTSTRATVPSDLYLIRNEAGQYLHIPFYSTTDSVRWSDPEPYIHPELLPSYQWVVMKRYENSDASQIVIMNREFDGTKFTIQLSNTAMSRFNIIGTQYYWNRFAVNHHTTTFGSHSGNKNTFIALPKQYKNDKFMGYEYIDRETMSVNVYALNYNHDYDQNRYLSWDGDYWKYPNTDTIVHTSGKSYYDRLYFKLDTALNYSKLKGYGFDPKAHSYKIADLVQLERQPYSLDFADPYKLLCNDLFTLLNGTQGEYIMGTTGAAISKYLGEPIFNLRHFYHKEEGGKLVPYFALAQRLNKESIDDWSSYKSSFAAYLTATYNKKMSDEIIAQLDISIKHKHTQNDGLETGVIVARVDDQAPNKLMAGLRLDEATIASTFRLEIDDDPIYRRFNTTLEADVADDTPKTLKFFWMDNRNYEMFENTGLLPGQKQYWEDYGIGTVKVEGKENYLGYVNINQYPNHTTAIYVDTAFINRGTGWIKPQYLLVVDPIPSDIEMICDEWGQTFPIDENYLRGRYLINATDSARGAGTGINQNSVRATGTPTNSKTVDIWGNPIGRSYLWENNWERLVFTDAIHAYDYDALYLVEGVDLTPYMYDGSSTLVDISKLDAASAPLNGVITNAKPVRKIFLGNNDHKDAVFQMRLIERRAVEFIIESETGRPEGITTAGINNNRKWGTSYGQLNSNGPIIAPCSGGWIKEQNGTAIISRSDMVHNLAQGLRMDVRRTDDLPTANEEVSVAAPTVIGGNNAVTILGAAGKKVVVSNVLGQTVASTVLGSDNASIAAPKGVVIVAIEGEAAVKTLVK